MIHDSDQPIIPIEINSPGGYAVSLADILDCCESSEKPIATFSTGMAASCGAALAMAGDNGLRFIGPNAHFLLHQASGFAWGKAADIEAEAKLLNKLVDKFVYQKCDKAANKKEGYTKNLIKQNFNADLSFMGQEAVDAGFFNQVGTISMLKNIDDLLFKFQLIREKKHLLENFNRVKEVFYFDGTEKITLTRISYKNFKYSYGNTQEYGKPQMYSINNDVINFYPKIDADYSLKVLHTAHIPLLITESNEIEFIPAISQQPVADYVTAVMSIIMAKDNATELFNKYLSNTGKAKKANQTYLNKRNILPSKIRR
jgi:ATP-dependent protease ClpP protease subunit